MATSTVPTTAERAPVLAPAAVGIVANEIERRRIKARLSDGSLHVLAAAKDVNTLLDHAGRRLDLVVFAGGAELLARGGAVELFRTLRPAAAVVIVSVSGTAVVRKALRAGVDGFVAEADLERSLSSTVSAVLAGQIAVPSSIREPIAWSAVSPRERQVLELVADGLTNAEIAERLFLSESTVKTHLSASFRKLGVSSRAEAAAAVLDPENGLVTGQRIAAPVLQLEQQLLPG